MLVTSLLPPVCSDRKVELESPWLCGVEAVCHALVSLDRREVALQHRRVIDGAVVMYLPPLAVRTTEEARRSYGELPSGLSIAGRVRCFEPRRPLRATNVNPADSLGKREGS